MIETTRGTTRSTTRSTTIALLGMLAACAGCRRSAMSEPPPAGQSPARLAPPAPAAPPAPGGPEVSAAAAIEGSPDDDPEGPLVGEERERDPRSETVTIRVTVDPPRKAHVVWGRKDLGEAPLEIERPRDSGPLDLIVTAPGYLPLHARAFTDRDDKLPLRIYTAEEASQLLGYRTEAKTSENRPQKAPPDRTRDDENDRSKKK